LVGFNRADLAGLCGFGGILSMRFKDFIAGVAVRRTVARTPILHFLQYFNCVAKQELTLARESDFAPSSSG
jgi:hypothetical protein